MAKTTDYAAVSGFYDSIYSALGTGNASELEQLVSDSNEVGLSNAARMMRSAAEGLEKYLPHLEWLDREMHFRFYESVKALTAEELYLYAHKAGELAASFEGRSRLTEQDVSSLYETRDDIRMYGRIVSAYAWIAECEDIFRQIDGDLWFRMLQLRMIRNVIGYKGGKKD